VETEDDTFNTLILLKIQRDPRNDRKTRGRNRGAEALAWQGFAGFSRDFE
jgi:hypothetical protein